MRYDACIFDLDGTLLNTLPTIAHYSNQTLVHFGCSPLALEQYQLLCRLPYPEFYQNLLQLGGCPGAQIHGLWDQAGQHDQKIYLEDPLHLTEPFPGVVETLKELKKRKVTLAVLTNKPHEAATRIVEKLFPDYFDLCVGHQPGSISKPDPQALLQLAEKLGYAKEACVYVGDTDIDVKTAVSAKVFSIAALWGYQDEDLLSPHHPDVMIQHPQEILQYF